MKAKLFSIAALLIVSIMEPPANAVTWRFDFASPRGGGFFEVDPTSFVIPTSAASPTNFNVVAADINIDAGGFLPNLHYTASSVFDASCTPGECSVAFEIPGIGTYQSIDLQLNFAEIWIPWITQDQQTIQMWQYTNPYASSIAWNDVGSVQRTVLSETPLPPTLPLFASGLGALGLIIWRRKRKNAAARADI